MSKTRKQYKKTKKNYRASKKHSKTYKKGGFFNFFSSKKVLPQECNLENVNQMGDYTDLHGLYQKCCPKSTFGFKNGSQLCKTIDQKYQQSWKAKNDALEYQGDETDPEKIEMLKNNPNQGAKRDCKALNVDNIYNKDTLQSLYSECCPKGFFGTKNGSPNCKKIDAKLKQPVPQNDYKPVPQNDLQNDLQPEVPMDNQEEFKEQNNISGGKKYKKKSKRTRRNHRK